MVVSLLVAATTVYVKKYVELYLGFYIAAQPQRPVLTWAQYEVDAVHPTHLRDPEQSAWALLRTQTTTVRKEATHHTICDG